MLKCTGALIILSACAGILFSWRCSCNLRIREMEMLCDLYRSAYHMMQAEHIRMPLFFARFGNAAECGKAPASAVGTFSCLLGRLLEERVYPTGEMAWQEAVRGTDWHLKKEEMSLLLMSGSAFFGRDLSDNLDKLERFEMQMKACCQHAKSDFAEKNRVWTPVGLLLGVLLVIVFV